MSPNEAAVSMVASKTGLKIETVKDLFENHWLFVEILNEPPKWVMEF